MQNKKCQQTPANHTADESFAYSRDESDLTQVAATDQRPIPVPTCPSRSRFAVREINDLREQVADVRWKIHETRCQMNAVLPPVNVISDHCEFI